MALTYTIDSNGQAANVSEAITSNALTVATGDYINVIEVSANNGEETAWTVTNTGTAITWGAAKQTTNTGSNCKIVHWTGIAGATPPGTVTVTATAGADFNNGKALFVIVHTGQHATDPLPAGNLFLLSSGTDKSQAITPTSVGSNLWMVVADWEQTNTFAAGTNCDIAVDTSSSTPVTVDISTQMTCTVILPETQPRTDTNSFTLASTDTDGTVIGIAFEVQAAADGAGPASPMFRGLT